MSELELTKINIVNQLRGLCAHCANNQAHSCPVQTIAKQVRSIRGIPLIVNNEFKGVLLAH